MIRRSVDKDEMSELVLFPGDDERFVLDDATADAIIDGTAPEGIPDEYRSLADLISVVRRPLAATDHADAEAVVVEMFRSIRHNPARPWRSTLNRKLSTRTIVLAGALTLVSAGAAAASGLPGAAQDTASAALAKLGVTVQGPNEHSADHANVRGTSAPAEVEVADAPAETPSEDETVPSSLPEQAAEIVAAATDPSTTGVDKGAAVSSLASDGKSRAGQNHRSADAHAEAAALAPAGPPASVPAGPPDGVPAGPPVSVPAGPPSGVPGGPPASTPAGPPADHPVGPPASTPPELPADHPSGPPVVTPQPDVPVSVPGGPPTDTPVELPTHP